MITPPKTETINPSHSILAGTYARKPQSPKAYKTEQRFAIAKAGPDRPIETAIFMHNTPVPAAMPEQIPMNIENAFQFAYPQPFIASTIPINPPKHPSTIRNTALADFPSIS